ncbi:MAG: hypothetical protein ACI4FY_05320 [Acetatifactor sp.]
MTKDTLEKFFQRYERFFMQSLSGEIDGDEMSELYAPEFIAASPIGVLAGKNDIDFDVHYLMQELNGKLRIFGWISGNEQELLKQYGVI